MKKVFLIGDSIRMGYDKTVRSNLSGEAEVYFTIDNNRFAQYVLRTIAEGIIRECDPQSIDVIHWNAGAWDILRMYGDEPLTPVDQYVQFLRRIHHQLKILCPNAKQIFATTTPVIESQFRTPERFMRRNSDVVLYNKAAVALMAELEVPVDDLYAVASRLGEEAWSDATHLYTESATKALSDAVTESIRAHLSEGCGLSM